MSERDLAKLLALVEKHLGRGYLDLADFLRESNQVGDIEQRILRGDYAGAVTKLEDAALMYAAEIHQSYVTAGRQEAKWLDAQPQLADRLVRFDETNYRAVERARANQYELIQGFAVEQREKTRAVLTEGLARGANPREMARDLRDGLGLTATQERWVANYRRSLEQGEWSRALGYELSDGRTDRTVSRMQRDGGQLTPQQIDAAVDRYRANALTYRAETIARTEALRSVHEGSRDLLRQAVERGDVEAEQLETTWHSRNPGPRARDMHQAMNDVTVKFGQDFILPDGTRMSGPGDPRGGAKHTANCGCATSTTIA